MITMHPGEYLSAVYFDELGMTQTKLADHLKVSKSAVSRLLSGEADVSPEMAVRLSYVLDRSAESWMEMQSQYSIELAKEQLDRTTFVAISLPTSIQVGEEETA